jgi:hypothetical protein
MTPTDELVFIDCPPPLLVMPEIDEVHVSVTFTWDIPRAELLAEYWHAAGVPVHVAGPAYNEPGGEFIPGRYLREGMVITSRGCPNNCWFCAVPEREGQTVRTLPITDGWNILDDNLLACPDNHIEAVFEMLSRQKEKPVFSGGLEAKRLKPWHAASLRGIKAKRVYFAYDTSDDWEPLVEAGKILRSEGILRSSHAACCYVLIGWGGDSIDAAEKRLYDTWTAGFVPYAMLYRDGINEPSREWARFQREWVRPEIVLSKVR